VALSPALGIMGAAVGTVLGALMHLGVRVLEIGRTDFRYRPAWNVRSAGFVEYVRLSIPKALAAPVEPLTFLFFTSVASTLVVGGISAVSFARNFQSVPVSLVGIAFAVAAFPIMARAASDGDRERFRRVVLQNLATIGLLTTVAAIGLIVVGGLAIDLFLGGEAFDADDVELTTGLLVVFALAVPFEAVSHLLARAVYSTRNTILPVAAALIGLGVTVATVLLLSSAIGITALPLGFVTGQATEVLLLVGAFAIRLRSVGPHVTSG
jgi:putative peptidoglycan lipid II flippase